MRWIRPQTEFNDPDQAIVAYTCFELLDYCYENGCVELTQKGYLAKKVVKFMFDNMRFRNPSDDRFFHSSRKDESSIGLLTTVRETMIDLRILIPMTKTKLRRNPKVSDYSYVELIEMITSYFLFETDHLKHAESWRKPKRVKGLSWSLVLKYLGSNKQFQEYECLYALASKEEGKFISENGKWFIEEDFALRDLLWRFLNPLVDSGLLVRVSDSDLILSERNYFINEELFDSRSFVAGRTLPIN